MLPFKLDYAFYQDVTTEEASMKLMENVSVKIWLMENHAILAVRVIGT